jgi:AcrR family transcriptional regulator
MPVKRTVKPRNKPDPQPIELKKLGRRRDHTRDTDILNAALEVLAESGYDGMTMDAVADLAKAGKATLYRRWASKEDLVLDAVGHMKRIQVDLDQLPDTGTLRGDLLALFKPQSVKEGEWRLKVMSGLSTMITQHQRLAEAGTAAIVEPWANAHFTLMKRAVERGTVINSADIPTLSKVIPSMAAFRSIVLRKPFDKKFLISLVDGVLMPALGIKEK